MTQPAAIAAHQPDTVRMLIRIEGIVQGVGYRPFVFKLASRLGISGFVANDQHGVLIEAEGSAAALAEFTARLRSDAPVLASIDALSARQIEPRGDCGFVIAGSRLAGARRTPIAPDVATCEDCLREIFDPSDRRYQYPFTNCTNCGPRFTIVRDIPYDRPATTMAGFAMCALCAREYHDPADRRFHAQPVCCPDCGPRLRLVSTPQRCDIAQAHNRVIENAARLLHEGAILAVKGLGGYHLAAAAGNQPAISRLRARKYREDKPFAVMASDLEQARRLAFIEDAEQLLLSGPRRPIVLLRRKPEAPVAGEVAPHNQFLGLMLPYTPLHHLLCAAAGEPIVMTSGNLSDEPIAYRDGEAFERLGSIADWFLTHDRPIHIRTDDSVVRMVRGREMPIRRSRGYAPAPLGLPVHARRPVLGCGAELKSTFCLARGGSAFVSHHIGDLENYASLRAFTEGIEHFRRLFEIDPQLAAHDFHPDYLSTRYALEMRGIELTAVQHHHAHVAACLADNGERGPVIGVAFDGLGYGADATVWGGEFLIADLCGFSRAAYFEPVPMPGGTAAIKEPWRMALAYLTAFGDEPSKLDVFKRNRRRWDSVAAAMRSKVNAPLTSSVGRLFDAAAAIIGTRDRVNYEGQAAVELEQMADADERGAYPAGGTPRIRGADLIRAVAEDVGAGTPPALAAARFHNGVAQAVVTACRELRDQHGIGTVALSGGVFQNLLLLDRVYQRLQASGFRVLTHSRVPANDGGISFGQVAIAAARDASGIAAHSEAL